MSNVTHIASRRHQETIRAIRHMLARAERGELGGVFFLVEELNTGAHVEGYIGDYRANPGDLGQRLGAVAVRLVGLQERIDDKVAS